MPKLQVYDPAMCCSTGICGPSVDPVLVQFAAALAWLQAQGSEVERYNLSQSPQAFAANGAVRNLLQEKGTACLPLVLVDSRVYSEGRYPDRAELASALGISLTPPATIYTEAVAQLVAIGAAIGSNCEPSFRSHCDQAGKLGVSQEDMWAAVQTALAVKEAPARSILDLAERHLRPATPGAKRADGPSMAGEELPLLDSGRCG